MDAVIQTPITKTKQVNQKQKLQIMKTKLSVEIYAHGALNTELLMIIGNNNSDNLNINTEDLAAYIKCEKAKRPITLKQLQFTQEEGLISVSEYGTPVILIEQKILYELEVPNELHQQNQNETSNIN